MEFVKKPHSQVEYTAEQIEELQKCAQDPIYFISKYCFIQNQQLGRILFKLRKYQKRIIRNFVKHRFNILLIGRQSGKTETTAAYAYWFAIFHKDKNVLVASNRQKGATDIMNRIKIMYEGTPDFLRPGASSYARGSIEFDNGSKIWSEATTEETGRGKSVALFILDELAHVQKRVQEEMWASILPTISATVEGQAESNLSCIIMSTPNGDTDLFAELWRGASSDTNGFNPIYVDVSEVPGRDEAWLKKMEAKITELKVRQEFRCEFLSSDPLLIKSTSLIRMKDRPPIYVDKGFQFWKKIEPTKTYLLGSDVSEGVQQDFSTVEVYELDTLEQVAEFRSNKIIEGQLYNAIKWVIEHILSHADLQRRIAPQIYWSFENNSAGAAIANLYYQDDKFPGRAELISHKETRVGMRTTGKTKIDACRHLKTLAEKAHTGFKFNSKQLIFELKNYIAQGASFCAKSGATDDLVSATLICVMIIKQLSEYEPEVFNKLYHTDEEFYQESTNEFDEPLPVVV